MNTKRRIALAIRKEKESKRMLPRVTESAAVRARAVERRDRLQVERQREILQVRLFETPAAQVPSR